MKVLRANIAVLLLGLMTAGSATAGDNLWMGFKAGTLGLGLEATWRPIPWLDVRAGFNKFDYENNRTDAGISYDATLALETYYATANVLFPVSPLRVTVGAFSNGNEFQMASLPAADYDIGNDNFLAAQVGTLRSTTYFEDVAPYLGVGFDFSIFGKVGLNLDFGVLWQGDPSVSLTASGPLMTDQTAAGDLFRAELAAEALQLESEFEDYKAYPVISLGLNFNFF